MSVIEKINVGGTAYNIADSQNIAPVEESSTSANAYAVGDLLIYQGQLYKVTSAIAVGNTLTVGTNIVATTISQMQNDNFTKLRHTIVPTSGEIRSQTLDRVYAIIKDLPIDTLVNCKIVNSYNNGTVSRYSDKRSDIISFFAFLSGSGNNTVQFAMFNLQSTGSKWITSSNFNNTLTDHSSDTDVPTFYIYY